MPCDAYAQYLLPMIEQDCRIYCKCTNENTERCRRCVAQCIRARGIDC